MKRTITTERIYQVQPYETFKVTDAIIEIPEPHATNDDVYNLVRTLQFVGLELSYRRYLRLINEYIPDDIEEAIEVLEEFKNKYMAKLQNILNETEGE